jgi:protein-glucosylgalactosylhydroxylysine glucosidase
LRGLCIRRWRFRRRDFERLLALGLSVVSSVSLAEPIDRYALVSRHDPVIETFDPESPLSVGNGEFAFTADATGLQTLPEAFLQTTPLGTLSQWGWHTSPNPEGWSIEKYKFTEFDAHGRKVGYADIPHGEQSAEIAWPRSNPHRLHLGQVGFRLTKAGGERATAADLTEVHQTLRLWDGVLVSHFKLEGEPAEVETVCHPTFDLLAVRVSSPLVAKGQVAIEIRFLYGTGETKTADWDHPGAHETKFTQSAPNEATFVRTLDSEQYEVAARWSEGGKIEEIGKHEFSLAAAQGKESLKLSLLFSPQHAKFEVADVEATASAASGSWHEFWSTGGAIDLSGSSDPRWRELERRIVLSQYLTAIQCSGDLPPQETGLTYNSWEGKFHLEMHWWNAVHFALWNRWPMFERSLDYYQRILRRDDAWR